MFHFSPARSRSALRLAAPIVLLAFAAIALAACEKPDASDVTSPSARILIGTTDGNVAYNPPETPPEPIEDPPGWRFQLGNARYATLENGENSIQVVTDIQSQQGLGMELWITGPEGAVYRWSGGSTRTYNGVVCFQLRLNHENEAMPLEAGKAYQLTMAFRDPGTSEVLVAKRIEIAGFTPSLTGQLPAATSEVGSVLLGCPRSVI